MMEAVKVAPKFWSSSLVRSEVGDGDLQLLAYAWRSPSSVGDDFLLFELLGPKMLSSAFRASLRAAGNCAY